MQQATHPTEMGCGQHVSMHANAVEHGPAANGSGPRTPFANRVSRGQARVAAGARYGAKAAMQLLTACMCATAAAGGGAHEAASCVLEAAAGSRESASMAVQTASVGVNDASTTVPQVDLPNKATTAEAALGVNFSINQTMYERRLPPMRCRGDGWVTLQLDNGSNTPVACSPRLSAALEFVRSDSSMLQTISHGKQSQLDGLWKLSCAVPLTGTPPRGQSMRAMHSYDIRFYGMADANRDLVSDGHLRKHGLTPVFQDRILEAFKPYVAIDGS